MKRRNKVSLFIAVTSILLTFVLNNGNAFAASVDDKIDAYDVWRCVGSGVRTIERDSFDGLKKLYGSTSEPIITKDGEKTDTISCVKLISKYLSADELTLGTNEMKDEVLRKLGYTNSESNMCHSINLEYKILGRSESWVGGIETDTVCLKNGKINVVDYSTPMSINGNNLDLAWLEYPSDNQIVVKINTDSSEPYTSEPISVNGNLRGALTTVANIINTNGTKSDYAYVRSAGINDKPMDYSYTLTKSSSSVLSDLTNASFSDASQTTFSKTEKRDLYEAYLRNYYAIDSICDEESAPSGYVQTVLSGSGKARLCYIKALVHDQDSDTVNALDGSGYFNGTRKNWKQIASELYDDWKDEVGETVEESEGIDGAGEPAFEECYNAGVDGVSWIVCPAINNMSSTVDSIDSLLNDMLSIDTAFYKSSSETYDVWEKIRDIANALMIVVLLTIIVSQITGYGIDNYGIKKMLPKLIVMAILVNLSFILCELAIDVSNIAGAGLSDMFKNIAGPTSTALTGGVFVSNVVAAITAFAAGAGASAGTALTIAGIVLNPGASIMLIIGLLLSLLVALVSILFFFISVGARAIIIILCAALSPLAFASYILPNTQGIFKKWWNIFKTALLVYPICGAMYGISFIIKAIVFQDGSGVHPLMALVGVMAPFLPFLALPSLIKGALSMVGNMAGALSSIGNSIRGGLNKGVNAFKNSEAYKEANNEMIMNRQNAMAQRTIDNIRRKMSNNDPSTLSEADRRRLGRARATMLANSDKMRRDERLSDTVAYNAAIIGQEKRADADNLANYVSFINDRTRNGEDEGALFSMYDEYVNSGDKFGAIAVAEIAGRRKDTAARFMSQKVSQNHSGYNSRQKEIFRSVAKEISTGKNVGNYMSANPLQFEYAAQANRSSNPNMNYENWAQDGNNIHRAIDNYVNKSEDLVNLKNGALQEMLSYMENGQMSEADARVLQGLARDAIRKHEQHGGEWDVTKADSINRMASWSSNRPTGPTFEDENSGNF